MRGLNALATHIAFTGRLGRLRMLRVERSAVELALTREKDGARSTR